MSMILCEGYKVYSYNSVFERWLERREKSKYYLVEITKHMVGKVNGAFFAEWKTISFDRVEVGAIDWKLALYQVKLSKYPFGFEAQCFLITKTMNAMIITISKYISLSRELFPLSLNDAIAGFTLGVDCYVHFRSLGISMIITAVIEHFTD